MNTRLQAIFDVLTPIDDDTIDAAMIEALPTADADAAELIAKSLLARKHTPVLVDLVARLGDLPQASRQWIVHHADGLYRVLAEAVTRRDTAAPSNVIAIIRESGSPRLAPILVDLLRSPDNALHTPAAECLHGLALEAVRHDLADEPMHDSEWVAPVVMAVNESMRLYFHHRRSEVLQAAVALLPRTAVALGTVLAQKSHPAAEPIRVILEDAATIQVRRSLLAFAALSATARSALAGVAHAAGADALPEVIETSHLLLNGLAVKTLRSAPSPEVFCPVPEVLHGMTPAQRLAVPRWLMALPIDAPHRLTVLGSLLKQTDPAIRLSALRALVQMPIADDVSELIASRCDDPDPALARIALRHLIRIQWHGLARLLLKLLHSSHGDIRKISAERLAPLGFRRFWDAWPRLTFAQQLSAGRALIKLDPGFARLLGEKLADADRPARLRALAMVHQLNQGVTFEPTLLAMLRDPDNVIVASVVRALGTAPSQKVVDALQKTLDHHDSRVRANTVEALQQLQATGHVSKLIDMAMGDDNRPRANAIGALIELRTGDALSSLVSMLNDHRPGQRISALWLVDNLGLLEVARQVAEMAVSDHHRDVRARASTVIHNLIETIRAATPREPALRAS